MSKSLIRGALAMFGLTIALAPATSNACWLTSCFSCCKPKPAPTFCPPPVAVCPPPAPVCDVCPQQVSYVPQTSYRAVEQCVPVTTCRPETVCDPCGGAQTVMRPVTTYTRRQVMVPYTTYRPVVTPVAAGCSTCSGAAMNSPYYTGTPVAAAPAMMAAPAAGGCTNCAAGYAAAATPATAVPAVNYETPGYSAPAATATPNYGQQTYGAPLTTQPQLPANGTPTPATPNPNGAGGTDPMKTFDSSGQPTNPSTSSYQPIPDATRMQNAPPFNGGTPASAPALLNPELNNRTTARPSYRSAILPAMFGTGTPKSNDYVKTASATRVVAPAPVPAAQPVNEGWRPLGGR